MCTLVRTTTCYLGKSWCRYTIVRKALVCMHGKGSFYTYFSVIIVNSLLYHEISGGKCMLLIKFIISFRLYVPFCTISELNHAVQSIIQARKIHNQKSKLIISQHKVLLRCAAFQPSHFIFMQSNPVLLPLYSCFHVSGVCVKNFDENCKYKQ